MLLRCHGALRVQSSSDFDRTLTTSPVDERGRLGQAGRKCCSYQENMVHASHVTFAMHQSCLSSCLIIVLTGVQIIPALIGNFSSISGVVFSVLLLECWNECYRVGLNPCVRFSIDVLFRFFNNNDNNNNNNNNDNNNNINSKFIRSHVLAS